jgi:hypothetical protein
MLLVVSLFAIWIYLTNRRMRRHLRSFAQQLMDDIVTIPAQITTTFPTDAYSPFIESLVPLSHELAVSTVDLLDAKNLLDHNHPTTDQLATILFGPENAPIVPGSSQIQEVDVESDTKISINDVPKAIPTTASLPVIVDVSFKQIVEDELVVSDSVWLESVYPSGVNGDRDVNEAQLQVPAPVLDSATTPSAEDGHQPESGADKRVKIGRRAGGSGIAAKIAVFER